MRAVRLHTLDVHGRPTQVRHAPGDGPPLVLLHGASGCGRTWERVLDHWAWADVWVPDLPGRGVAGEPLDRVPALAGWLAEVVAQTAGAGAIVVGHSLGGAIGLQLALDHPDALSRLVMVASSARLKVSPAILQAVAQSSERSPLDLRMAFGPDADDAIKDAYHQDAHGVPAAAALADWQACDAFDVRERLGEVGLPVHVVYGTADRFTPAKHQVRLVDALPDGTTATVREGGGHMLPWESPGEVAEAVRVWTAG